MKMALGCSDENASMLIFLKIAGDANKKIISRLSVLKELVISMVPFCVKKNHEFGRFAVATKEIQSGEIVLSESPFVVGPKSGSLCVCLECFRRIDATANGTRCKNCFWPLCVDHFERSCENHKRECDIFKAAKCKFFNLSDPDAICLQLDCITPLRVLLERQSNFARWASEVDIMEHHREKRFGTPSWNMDSHNIVGYLLGPCKMRAFKIDEELIQKVIGILEVNAFEAKTVRGDSIRCLYTKLAIPSHSCTPNITHSIHPSRNYEMQARATMSIVEGTQLYSCYTYTLNGTMDRQKHLMEGKFFQCHCERCLDPSELGTNFSSLKCTKCNTGSVKTSDPLNLQATWKCNKCQFQDSSENVDYALKTLQHEIDSTKSIELLEKLLIKFDKILHSNHFLMISIKNALIDSYGHLKEYALANLPDVLLYRKVELCEEVLAILNVFESEKSRARAVMMYEMHAPLVLYVKSQYQNGNFTKLEYLKQLKRARVMLNECIEILDWEDPLLYGIALDAHNANLCIGDLIDKA